MIILWRELYMTPQQCLILAVAAVGLLWFAMKQGWIFAGVNTMTTGPMMMKPATWIPTAPMSSGDLIPANEVLSGAGGGGGYGGAGSALIQGAAVPSCLGSVTYSQKACDGGAACTCKA